MADVTDQISSSKSARTVAASWAVVLSSYAAIAASGITAADTVTAVLGTSKTVASSSLELKGYRFPFATAVLLEAGKTYLLAAVNASGTSTTVNRVSVVSRGGSSGWDVNAPGETDWGTPQLDSIGLGVGQAPAAFGTGKFLIAVEGEIV